MNALELLRARGLVEQVTAEDELAKALDAGPMTIYAGFDPTADSLHCGHLLPLMGLARLQRLGHRVIALVGGGTGRIGDPSGRTELRKVLSHEQIDANVAAIRGQIERFIIIDGEQGLLVNNADWLLKWSYVDWLREVGRHFTVNRMLAVKTYRDRFEGENGLNFIEFNYQLLQSYDFLHLFREHDCRIQIGGNDQWGNIVAGVDLIRRVTEDQGSFGLTIPLITTASGAKMGKTADGAVWLDASKTSPNDLYQYWRSCQDADVAKFLKVFTFLELDEIDSLTAESGEAMNEAKRRLAFEMTKTLHGEAAAEAARAAEFGSVSAVPAVTLEAADAAQLDGEGLGLLDAFVRVAGLLGSNGEVRRGIKNGGVKVNGEPVKDPHRRLTRDDFDADGNCLLSFGKKKKKRLCLG